MIIKKIIKYIVLLLVVLTALLWILDFNFSNKQFSYYKIKNLLSNKDIAYLKKKSTEFIDYDFTITKEKEYLLKNNSAQFEKLTNKFLKNRHYLTQNETDIFAITTRGDLFFSSKKEIIDEKRIELKKIKTNINEVIGKEYIEEYNLVVKSVLIINEKIYVSYIHSDNECYSNAIIEGSLNYNKIKFSTFLKLDECNKTFGHQVGGNLDNFKNNKILLTLGDFYDFEVSQNKNSFYGKILSIDLNTKSTNILSMGHRNQQGLFYDSKNDIIFSAEHGPQGGDEINANINPNKNEIKNYGWPISSNGEHYGADENYSNIFSERRKNNPSGEGLKDSPYWIAPLHNSHKKYGFEEPIKNFTPSIGITQILKVDNSINDDYKIIVGSLGDNEKEGDMTLHILNFNKNFKETEHQKIFIGERIRDMIDLSDGNILITLDTSGSFGLIRNIY
tara:strand:+ start:5 stop:1345 length:1341 start_codon:yes stop_codon:yes gene_type:complete